MTESDGRKPPARRWAIAALAVVVAVGALAAGRTAIPRARGGATRAVDSPVFTVAEGPLTIGVSEAGTVKPMEVEILKSEIEGRTTILYLIEEGKRVKQGDLLVELDASQLQDQKIDQETRVQNAEAESIRSHENLEVVKNQARSDVDKAELTLRFAREDLEQYKAGEYPNALKEQEAKITVAREERQRARQKLEWSRVLFREKYLAESELQADELAAKKAELDEGLATNSMALLRQFTYRRKIAQLESDVKQAEMALERTRRKASADVVQAEAESRAKEAEFKREGEKLEKIKAQIAKAKITAPRDGLVVYATSTRAGWRGDSQPLAEGQEVRERQELIHLPTASTFVAEVKLHESNLDKIRVGQSVRITVDAVPGREFGGTVSTIAPLPDATSMFMNPDLKLYNTTIRIDGGGDVLRTGMSCRAEVVVERYDAAVYVPIQCVVRQNGRHVAYVKTRSAMSPREVRIGLDNNRVVRVLSGLKAGEAVLLAPPLETAAGAGGTGGREAGSGGAPAQPAVPGPAAAVGTGDDTRRGSGAPAAAPPSGALAPAEAAGSTATATAAGNGQGRGGRQTSAEDRQRMRERFEKMSPEERAAMQRQWRERSGKSREKGAEQGTGGE